MGTDEHPRSCTDCASLLLLLFAFLSLALSLLLSFFHSFSLLLLLLLSHANSRRLHTCPSQDSLTHPLPPYWRRYRLLRCCPVYSSQRPRCQGQSGLCFHNRSQAQHSVHLVVPAFICVMYWICLFLLVSTRYWLWLTSQTLHTWDLLFLRNCGSLMTPVWQRRCVSNSGMERKEGVFKFLVLCFWFSTSLSLCSL